MSRTKQAVAPNDSSAGYVPPAIVSGNGKAISGNGDRWLLRVTDLKQYDYCPRVVYYEYCLPGVRPTTYKMEAGISAQDKTNELEKRRTLREYGVNEGVRHFHVALTSQKLNCTGRVDLVLETGTGSDKRLIPIDFKLSRHEPGRHFHLQIACYGLMLEENWDMPAPEGIIYLIPTKLAVHVKIDVRLRRDAQRKLQEIRQMVETETMPAPTHQLSKCVSCEFRRFCNDVL